MSQPLKALPFTRQPLVLRHGYAYPGVSLKTVQRYADKGRLRVARVLPSGYRQFDPADVEALRAQIYAAGAR